MKLARLQRARTLMDVKYILRVLHKGGEKCWLQPVSRQKRALFDAERPAGAGLRVSILTRSEDRALLITRWAINGVKYVFYRGTDRISWIG
jgi:hypothetical protein